MRSSIHGLPKRASNRLSWFPLKRASKRTSVPSVLEKLSIVSLRRKSGVNLPTDCLYNIFEYLTDDKKTLRACLFVNRSWCETAVPLFWVEPFEHINHVIVIETYISCLSEKERHHLARKGLPIKTTRKVHPTFNYVAFMRHLNTNTLYEAICRWTEVKDKPSASPRKSIALWHSLLKLLLSQRANIQWLSFDYGRLEMMNQYPTVIQQISHNDNIKKVTIHYIPDWKMLPRLGSCVSSIETLEILDYSLSPPPERPDERLFAEFMSKLKNLRRFKLFGHGAFPQIMVASIGQQAITIASVELVYINFQGIGGTSGAWFEGLVACKNLRDLVVRDCNYASEGHLAPLADARFPRLRKLHFSESTYAWDKLIVKLIENNPANLEEVCYQPSNEHFVESAAFLRAVTQRCPNLTTLGIPLSVSSRLTDFSNLGCQLRHLTIFMLSNDQYLDLVPFLPGSLRKLSFSYLRYGYYMYNMESFKSVVEESHCQPIWFDVEYVGLYDP